MLCFDGNENHCYIPPAAQHNISSPDHHIITMESNMDGVDTSPGLTVEKGIEMFNKGL